MMRCFMTMLVATILVTVLAPGAFAGDAERNALNVIRAQRAFKTDVTDTYALARIDAQADQISMEKPKPKPRRPHGGRGG